MERADKQAIMRNTRGGTTESIVDYEELANLLNKRMRAKTGGANQRLAIMLGMLTNSQTIQANIPSKNYSQFSQERYKFLLYAPFEISNKCCNVMKKEPAKRYGKETGRVPITAQMAAESRLRTQVWLKNGCNAFDAKKPMSNPMSFWTEQDVLLYIRQNNLPICKVYKEVQTEDESVGQLNFADMAGMELFDLGNALLHTTGVDRSGCIFCGFGAHCEKKGRFELIDEVSNPALRDFCMRGGAFDTDGLWKPDNRGLGYFFVLQWINIAGGFHIHIPEYDRYLKEYGNDRVYEELEKAKEIRERTKK